MKTGGAFTERGLKKSVLMYDHNPANIIKENRVNFNIWSDLKLNNIPDYRPDGFH